MDIRDMRCCMCPNSSKPSNTICPEGPLKAHKSMCTFALTFIDKNGWRYRVMDGIGDEEYKAKYNEPGTKSWKDMKQLQWQTSFDSAQKDLNRMAIKNGWSVAAENI